MLGFEHVTTFSIVDGSLLNRVSWHFGTRVQRDMMVCQQTVSFLQAGTWATACGVVVIELLSTGHVLFVS